MIKRIIIGSILTPFLLCAKPTGPEVTHGKATFAHPSNSHMHIITGEQTIINWQDFSIDAGEIIRFIQPNTQSAVLNRITSHKISHLMGTLEANGKVLLVNPNGIVIGSGGVINTHTFIGSTLDVLDNEFLQGKELLFRGNSNQSVINLGTINAWDGDVILIGRTLDNQGAIQAKNGMVALAAAKEVLIKPSDTERVFISPSSNDVSTKEVGVSNQGTIEGLKVRLLADGNPYKFAIKHQGKIDALGVEERNGEVYLVAENGVVEVCGEICTPKGEVRILGQKVGLFEKAFIDASSDFGGGKVLIGGSFQGKDKTILNAELTVINPNTEIRVNSNKLGNAGSVVVWSDGTTLFNGLIEAKGGQEGGDGGLVEISGKVNLDMKQGKADRTAVAGKAGSLLLDPSDIIIAADSSSSVGISFLNFSYIPTALSCIISRDALIANANAGPVEITTTSGFGGNGDIIVKAPMNMANGYGSPFPLTLTASRDLIITDALQNMGSGDLICNVGRDLVLDSSSAPALLGTQDGNVKITTGRDLLIAAHQGHHAMIGFDFPSMDSNIEITVGNDLIIQGINQFALIGHTNTTGAAPRTFKGDIKINSVGRDVKLIGGESNNAFAQIGLATNQRRSSLPSNCIGDVVVKNIGGKVTLMGGSSLKDSYAMIGHGGRAHCSSDIFKGDISVQAVGDITIIGGQGSKGETFSGIGFGQNFSRAGATHTFSSNSISVQSTEGTVSIRGGIGPNPAFIGAYTGKTAGTSNCNIGLVYVAAAKDLFLHPNLGPAANADAALGIAGVNGPANCNIEIEVGGNLNLIGGTPLSGVAHAAISNGGDSNSGNIKIRVEKGNINLTGGLPRGDGESRAFIHSTGNLTIDIEEGDLNLSAHNLALIHAFGSTTLSIGGAINLEGDPFLDGASIMALGPLIIQANQDINLINNATIENQSGNLKIIAGHDLNMSDKALISNKTQNPISIVVDYRAHPTLGVFNMASEAEINGDGPIRLFFPSQQHNTLQGLINGTRFIPGPLFADQSPEKWHANLSSDFFYAGAPFTVLYVDKVAVQPSQGFLVGQHNLRSEILISELLEKLHPYDEYLGWFLQFQTAYEIEKYVKHTHTRELSSAQVLDSQPYFLRMHKRCDQCPRLDPIIHFYKRTQIKPQLGQR